MRNLLPNRDTYIAEQQIRIQRTNSFSFLFFFGRLSTKLYGTEIISIFIMLFCRLYAHADTAVDRNVIGSEYSEQRVLSKERSKKKKKYNILSKELENMLFSYFFFFLLKFFI